MVLSEIICSIPVDPSLPYQAAGYHLRGAGQPVAYLPADTTLEVLAQQAEQLNGKVHIEVRNDAVILRQNQ